MTRIRMMFTIGALLLDSNLRKANKRFIVIQGA
jgi:hypothetical protein